MLEVVDAVVFGLGYAEEGAVAEFWREGDTAGGVGPGFQVGGEERAVVLGVAVMVVVGEVAGWGAGGCGYGNDGGAFGPVVGDGWGDVGPGAFHGGGLRRFAGVF